MLNFHEVSKTVKTRKRVGRGGSRGGQSGRGGKGQTARSGGSIKPGFEGGQMPLHRRTPKRGFNNKEFQKNVYIVNLDQLEKHFGNNELVNKEALINKGIIKARSIGTYIKILGDGHLSKKLNIVVDACSQKARTVIVSVGGTVTLEAKKE
ncbi:50S ribosomal protein L15 [bacterium]|nr:MAG: 50S ribosomal protein L15 [bacterium]QQR62028.1 MAG: 50S ribosomal protein L15 [bacterium]QQR62377.1 MAG: 50S ribosomal protein L15 [bacterium]